MRKRFIAGAKCPQCQQEDKIFVFQQNGEDIAQCNACGYQSIRPKTVEQGEHNGEHHDDHEEEKKPDGVVIFRDRH